MPTESPARGTLRVGADLPTPGRMDLPWREKAAALPEAPGVYQFLDARSEVIYIGKALSLKQRVKSYVAPWESVGPKEQAIQERARDLRFIVTSNEMEAMLTEATLVKQLQPLLNTRLKDDKRYPYLRISTSEPFPRLSLVRLRKEGKDRYFGPFTDTGALRRTIRTLKEIFHIPSCKVRLDGKALQPCLDYRIGRCPAPCTQRIDPNDYRQVVEEVVLFLEGKGDALLHLLEERMQAESKKMKFERAALYRDQLFALRTLFQQQVVLTRPTVNRDLVAFLSELGETCMVVLKVRGGKLAGEEHFFLVQAQAESPPEVAAVGLVQYYQQTVDLPKEVVLNIDPRGQALPPSQEGVVPEESPGSLYLRYLEVVRRIRVFVLPKRGERKVQLELAEANTREHLHAYLREKSSAFSHLDLLTLMQRELGLPALPVLVECYDISNLGPLHAVGSRVVFRNGTKHRPGFRHYKIRHSGQDDYESMREVLRRRLSSEELPPDLLLIDGGRGHLQAALEVLEEKGLSVPLASLAKENEWVYRPDLADPLVLPRHDPALQYLQRMRDEAHRFAVSFHRKLRGERIRHSSLDEFPGIGPAKKRILLQAFGSYRVVQRASISELASLPGLGEKTARTIYNRIHHDEGKANR